MSDTGSLTLPPLAHFAGDLVLPGSKSLSNRILLLAALARGTTHVENLLDADDIQVMLSCLDRLGVRTELSPDRSECTVHGLGAPFRVDRAKLFLGNAGTAMRPLCAVLAASEGTFTMSGEPRMHERPIGHLVDALRALGASIGYDGAEGYPPLTIDARGLDGGRCVVDGSVSSQFLSAVLLAAPLARGRTTIEVGGELVSAPYVEMTLKLMRRFGAEASEPAPGRYDVPAAQQYRSPGRMLVEGDASSASYFLAAAAIAGGRVRVHGVGTESMQGDVQFVDVLEQMGATVRRGPTWLEVERGSLRGVSVDATDFPDAAMTLATTALFAAGPTEIRGIGNWRVKETDRLGAMATELRKVGAEVVEGADFIHVVPPAAVRPAAIDTYHDHRMAMCFSLAAFGGSPIVIRNPGVTSKTFPTYFARFAELAGVSLGS